MTLKTRIKQLEEEQDGRDKYKRRCTCQLVILIQGERMTEEQQAILARNATCNASHSKAGVTVIEAPLPAHLRRKHLIDE